jgi:hypothetical protein
MGKLPRLPPKRSPHESPMDTPPELLFRIQQAFQGVQRPEHFTNYQHCDECFDHDETLRGQTPETIGLTELGNPGWDPICFISVEGFHYYLPALSRLALGQVPEYYLDQFLFHLRWPPERSAPAIHLRHAV